MFFTNAVLLLFFHTPPSLKSNLIHKEEVNKGDDRGPKGCKPEMPSDRESISKFVQDVEHQTRDSNTTGPEGNPEEDHVDAVGEGFSGNLSAIEQSTNVEEDRVDFSEEEEEVNGTIHTENGATKEGSDGGNVVKSKTRLLMEETITEHRDKIRDEVAGRPDTNKSANLGVDEVLFIELEGFPGAGKGGKNQKRGSDRMDKGTHGVDVFEGAVLLGVEDDSGNELEDTSNKTSEDKDLRGGIGEVTLGGFSGRFSREGSKSHFPKGKINTIERRSSKRHDG